MEEEKKQKKIDVEAVDKAIKLLKQKYNDDTYTKILKYLNQFEDDEYKKKKIDDLERIFEENSKKNIQKKKMSDEKGDFYQIDEIINNPIKKFDITFSDVIGLDAAKDVARFSLIYPLDTRYKSLNMQPTNSLLLFGLPGTGKTLFSKAILGEVIESAKTNEDVKINYYELESSQFKVAYVGQTERNIAYFFGRIRGMIDEDDKEHSKFLSEKKEEEIDNFQKRKIVIFIDEFDSLAKERETAQDYEVSIVTTLLLEWNKLNEEKYKNVFLILATNFPNKLDKAIKSRINDKIYIKLPDINERLSLINIFFEENDNFVGKDEREFISKSLVNFSGRTIKIFLNSLKRSCRKGYYEKNYVRKTLSIRYSSNDYEEKEIETYIYCEKDDEGAENKNKKLQEGVTFHPIITFEDVIKEINNYQPENQSDIDDLDKYDGKKEKKLSAIEMEEIIKKNISEKQLKSIDDQIQTNELENELLQLKKNQVKEQIKQQTDLYNKIMKEEKTGLTQQTWLEYFSSFLGFLPKNIFGNN